MLEKTIRLVHTADIHLDTPFSSINPRQAAQRCDELRSAFAALMMYVRVNNTDIVLIAGDLFDCDYATRDTVHLLQREFSANHDTRFIIAPGNHDPFTSDSIYASAVFPDNVYIFKSSEVSCFSFDDIGVDVYGYAFTDRRMDKNPLTGFVPEDKENGRIRLLCAHCELGRYGEYAPISEEELLNCGFDYAALGHIHNTEGILNSNNRYYGYCGCLEGRDFGECGYKGAISAVLHKGDKNFDASITGLRFSRRRYEKTECDLSGCHDSDAVYNKISDSLSQYGNDTILRLTLTGNIPSDVSISQNYIKNQLASGLYSLEICDNLSMPADVSALENDPTLRGEYYRVLKDFLNSDDDKTRQRAELALRMGLTALSGGNPASLQ